MRNQKILKQLIEVLRETPIILYACAKVGISRAHFYRIRDKNKDFRDQVSKALEEGIQRTNDLARAVLLKGIQNGDIRLVMFWLQHFDSQFKRNDLAQNKNPYTSVGTVVLTPEEEERVRNLFAIKKIDTGKDDTTVVKSDSALSILPPPPTSPSIDPSKRQGAYESPTPGVYPPSSAVGPRGAIPNTTNKKATGWISGYPENKKEPNETDPSVEKNDTDSVDPDKPTL